TPPSPGIRGFWQVPGRVPGTRASPPPATESHHQFEFCLLLSSNVELIIDNREMVHRWRAAGCRRPGRKPQLEHQPLGPHGGSEVTTSRDAGAASLVRGGASSASCERRLTLTIGDQQFVPGFRS